MSFSKLFALFLGILLVLTIADYQYLERPTTGIDDANIYLTYARNLAHGHGFVYNPGGERVEGFTSLLWVLVASVFYLISDNPEMLLMGFLLVLTALTITLIYQAVRRDVEAINTEFARRHMLWLYTGFIVCISPTFISWSVLSLMENGLWNFMFAIMVLLVLNGFRSGGYSRRGQVLLLLTGSGLITTRPEGMGWVILFAFFIALAQWRGRRSLAFPLGYLVAMGAAIAGMAAIRLAYFGYPLPNTYYAKVSDDKLYNAGIGYHYALSFLTHFNLAGTLLLALLVVSGFRMLAVSGLKGMLNPSSNQNETTGWITAMMAVVVMAGVVLPIPTGADHFAGFRFYQYLLPLLAWGIPAALVLAQDPGSRRLFGFPMAGLLFFGLIALGNFVALKRGAPATQLIVEFSVAINGRHQARLTNSLFPENRPSIGIMDVGGFGYAYQGPTIDIMGLNSTLMAHSPGDRKGPKNHAAFNKETFYKLRPDLLFSMQVPSIEAGRNRNSALVNPDDWINTTLKRMFSDPAFFKLYQPTVISRKGVPEMIFTYVRRDYVPTLAQDKDLVINIL